MKPSLLNAPFDDKSYQRRMDKLLRAKHGFVPAAATQSPAAATQSPAANTSAGEELAAKYTKGFHVFLPRKKYTDELFPRLPGLRPCKS